MKELIGSFVNWNVYRRVVTSGPAAGTIQSIIKNEVTGKCLYMQKVAIECEDSTLFRYIVVGHYALPKMYDCLYDALKDNGFTENEIDGILTFLRFK